MSRLRKWRQQSRVRRKLWLKAALVLTVIGVSLRLMSFSSFRKWYSKWPQVKPVPDEQVSDLVWAVESAAYHLPLKLLCLPQALAVKYLLGRSDGIVMHIGFNKTETNPFEFHAWVEKQGETIIGNLPTRYQPLWVWE